jgi:hypothetical protein
LPDIEAFYDDSFEVVELNQQLLNMAIRYPQASKMLTTGRVVVLKDGVSILVITRKTLIQNFNSISRQATSEYY